MLFAKLSFIVIIVLGFVSCKYETLSSNVVKELIDCKKLNAGCPELCKGLSELKPWAIKMVDAMSKLPNGILQGNIMDFGNYDECIEIDDQTDNIRGKYCAYALTVEIILKKAQTHNLRNLNSTEYSSPPRIRFGEQLDNRLRAEEAPKAKLPIMFSLCLPSSCSPSDFKNSAKLISQSGFLNVRLTDQMCQINDSPELNVYDYVVIPLFSIIILCVISCTFYDVMIQKQGKKPAHPLLVSFSLYTNGRKLLAITSSPDQLQCLNGIRFISMMWVVAGHRFSSAQSLPSDNRSFVNEWKSAVYAQYIKGAPLAVDTFLCISGIVLSYSFLKSQRNPRSKFNVILFYVHRYIRLTPAVAALYFLSISLFKYLGQGPLFPYLVESTKKNCLKYWWSYFLYVQNYVNMNEICWIHTWYISMDMQIFILSPLFLLPLLKFKKPTLYVMYAATVVFIIIPFVITYIYETAMFTQDYYDYYYYVTHTRLAPWIIGLIAGVFVLDRKSKPYEFSALINLAIWLFVLIVMGTLVFTGNDIMTNFERLKNAFYLALHRPVWSMGVCWIVYACVKGHGGIIGWFLSLPAFQVLARLTYSMYIVHVVIISVNIGRMRMPMHLSDYDLFYVYCGDLMMTLIVAVIWTLLFESPIIIIEKWMFGGATTKKPVTESTREIVNETPEQKEKV